MMIRVYDKSYLPDFMENMGAMMEFATLGCGCDLGEWYSLFLSSRVPRQVERGNPNYLAGMSGMELAYKVAEDTGYPLPDKDEYILRAPGPEYWAGWALACLQWHSGKTFSMLQRYGLGAEEAARMYYPLHEADVSHFVETAMSILSRRREEMGPPLKLFRKERGVTQTTLAEHSGVSLRMIQAYEQETQDISRAEAGAVLSLARVLGCRNEDLLQ